MTSDHEIAEVVARNGWQIIDVYDGEPSFLYTCGLMSTWSHAELVVFGLESSDGSAILAAMVERIKLGDRFEANGIYSHVISQMIVAARRVHPSRHEMFLGYAMGHCRYTDSGELRAMQVFWPDAARRFPFDGGCELRCYELQPRLDFPATNSELRAFRRQFE